MPFSVSVGDALELLVSDVVVSVGVWSTSVDAFLSGDEVRWLGHGDGRAGGGESCDKGEFHFLLIN